MLGVGGVGGGVAVTTGTGATLAVAVASGFADAVGTAVGSVTVVGFFPFGVDGAGSNVGALLGVGAVTGTGATLGATATLTAVGTATLVGAGGVDAAGEGVRASSSAIAPALTRSSTITITHGSALDGLRASTSAGVLATGSTAAGGRNAFVGTVPSSAGAVGVAAVGTLDG